MCSTMRHNRSWTHTLFTFSFSFVVDPLCDFCVAGPDKKCEPKVVVNDFPKPTSAEFSRSLGVQSHPKVFIQQHKVKEGDSSFGGLSPLVPIRLSQRFHNVASFYLFVCPFMLFVHSNFPVFQY